MSKIPFASQKNRAKAFLADLWPLTYFEAGVPDSHNSLAFVLFIYFIIYILLCSVRAECFIPSILKEV